MNFKDYSLKEHLHFTENAIYNKERSLRIDIPEGTMLLGHQYGYATQSTGKFEEASISDRGGTISIGYDQGTYAFLKQWSTETFTGVNVHYKKDISRNKILKKESDFYTKTLIQDTIKAYKRNFNDNTRVGIEITGTHKEYELVNLNSKFSEKYTLSSKKLVASTLHHNYIGIYMTKKLSHSEGSLTIRSFKKDVKVSFKFEGEPCLFRLLNKTFIFDALISTDLALIIDDVQTAIVEGMELMKKTPTHIKHIDEILEYYKNNAI